MAGEFIYVGVRESGVYGSRAGFLGIGDPAMISWGEIMQDAMKYNYLEVWKWWLLPAGVMLSMTIVGLTFVGNSVEAVIDPRLRGVEVA